MKHQPRLDGIRALAVLAVVGFHATSILPGGWLGVDIFFVLSGYLITAILLTEHRRFGRIDFKRFYIRRLLRLAPALLMATTISVPLLLAFRGVEAAYEPLTIVAGVIAYVGNWMQVGNPVSLGPLTHTWSLAIEEQFYIVWPPLLALALARVDSLKRIANYCAALVLGLVALRAALAVVLDEPGLWFATTSRSDALIIGAMVAILGPSFSRRASTWMFSLSGAALAVFCLVPSEFSTFMLIGGLTMVALLASAFIASSRETPLAGFLEWKPLRAIGQVSYGIYLYHYPVFFLVNYSGMTGLAAYATKVVLTAVLVIASWLLVEKPILGLKGKFEPKDRRPVHA